MLALSRRTRTRSESARASSLARVGLPWTLGVAGLWGLTFLSGEPRAIATIELLTHRRCSLRLDSAQLLLADLLAPADRLPGDARGGICLGLGHRTGPAPARMVLHQLLRALTASATPSLAPGRSPCAGAHCSSPPTSLAATGPLASSGYFANYNLAEVTGYAGVLALVAGLAFLTRVQWRGWRGADRDYMHLRRHRGGGALCDVGKLHPARPRLSRHSACTARLACRVAASSWWTSSLSVFFGLVAPAHPRGRPEQAGLGRARDG